MNRLHTFAPHLFSSTRWILTGFIFLFPIFFLPFTLDPLEINKQSLLLLSVCLSAVLLLGAVLIRHEIRFRFHWVSVLLCLFCFSIAVSAFFSPAPFLSWIGTSGSEYVSVLTWAGLGLLFFLCFSFRDELCLNRILFYALMASAALAGIIGILSALRVGPQSVFPLLYTAGFSTVSNMSGLAIFLLVMSFWGLIRLVTGRKNEIGLTLFVCAEMWFMLLALDAFYLWMLSCFGSALIFSFALFRPHVFPSVRLLTFPVVMMMASVLFALSLPSPFSFRLPIEVSPSFGTSLLIARESLSHTNAFFGSGPGTFAFDYAKYHSSSVNATDFWNTRFDRATSFFLTLVPTIGFVGVVFFLLMILSMGGCALSFLTREKKQEPWISTVCAFVPWVILIGSAFFFPWNMTFVVLFIVLSAELLGSVKGNEWSIRFSRNKPVALLSAIVFVVCFLALFVGIFLTVGRYMAEVSYSSAVRADRKNMEIKTIVEKLDRAALINRWDDDYVRNLSTALLWNTQDLLSKGTETSLSETSKKYLQELVAASVNASARATELSPNNVQNWLTRGEVYRTLSGIVPKASSFSLDAYTHAIQLDPVNPNTWTERGKTHLSIADAFLPLTVSDDASSASRAQTDRQSALDQAERDFLKAIELKSNYAPAHFELALLYDREGKLDAAIEKLETVQTYNATDVGVGFELGSLYLKRGSAGDLEKSKIVFLHVIELAPSYSDAHWLLASVYEKRGENAEAVKELEVVEKLNPDNPIVKTRLRKLRQMGFP